MASESKDKKRKGIHPIPSLCAALLTPKCDPVASDTASASKPPKKTKKCGNDDGPAPAEAKPQLSKKSSSTKARKPDSSVPKITAVTNTAPPGGPTATKKPKSKGDSSSEDPNALASKARAPRKRAADFLSDSETNHEEDGGVKVTEKIDSEAKETGPQKKRKKSKDQKDKASIFSGVPETENYAKASDITSGGKAAEATKPKKERKDKKLAAGLKSLIDATTAGNTTSEIVKSTDSGTATKAIDSLKAPSMNCALEHESSDDGLDDGEEDEQTAALLKGFESSDESSEDESPEDSSSEANAEKYEMGMTLPRLDISKKQQKKLAAVKCDAPGGTGVVYIGYACRNH